MLRRQTGSWRAGVVPVGAAGPHARSAHPRASIVWGKGGGVPAPAPAAAARGAAAAESMRVGPLRSCPQAEELVFLRGARWEEASRGGPSPVRGHELGVCAPRATGLCPRGATAGQCGLVSSGHGHGVCALVQQNWHGCPIWGFCRSLVIVQMPRGPATQPACMCPRPVLERARAAEPGARGLEAGPDCVEEAESVVWALGFCWGQMRRPCTGMHLI